MTSSHLFQNASGFHISGPSFVINAPSGNDGNGGNATFSGSSSDCFPREEETQANHEIYVQSLLMKKHGLPVWRPDPQGTHVPPEYNTSGVQIGDVGFVANDGSFEYVFNITLPAHHPVNLGRTPPDFNPISSSDTLTRTQSMSTISASLTLASRCRTVEDKHKPGDLISHPRIRCLRLGPVNSPQAGLGLGYKIITSASRGAILVIPEGGLSRDLINYRDFLSYAQQNAVSWYSYINGTLGRQVPNCSLYLVTGYDKSSCWGVAAFSNPDREEMIMRFQQNAATIPTVQVGSGLGGDTSSANPDSSLNGIQLIIPLTNNVPGSQSQPRKLRWSEKYYWIQDSVIDTSTRSGPESLAVIGSDSDVNSIDEAVKNQCLFIRGYKIALGEKPRNPFARVVVDAKDVGDLEPEDLKRSRIGRSIPFGLNSGSSTSIAGSNGDEGSSSSGSQSDLQEPELLPRDTSIVFSHVPELEDIKMTHPSDIINDFLLNTDENFDVALTHDEEWMSLIDEADQDLPDRNTLLARLSLKFKVASDNGRVHLADIDSGAVTAGLDYDLESLAVVPDESEARMFSISPSGPSLPLFHVPLEYPPSEMEWLMTKGIGDDSEDDDVSKHVDSQNLSPTQRQLKRYLEWMVQRQLRSTSSDEVGDLESSRMTTSLAQAHSHKIFQSHQAATFASSQTVVDLPTTYSRHRPRSTPSRFRPIHFPFTVMTVLPLGLPQSLTGTSELTNSESNPVTDSNSELAEEKMVPSWTSEVPLELLEASAAAGSSEELDYMSMDFADPQADFDVPAQEEDWDNRFSSSRTLVPMVLSVIRRRLPTVPLLPYQLKMPVLHLQRQLISKNQRVDRTPGKTPPSGSPVPDFTATVTQDASLSGLRSPVGSYVLSEAHVLLTESTYVHPINPTTSENITPDSDFVQSFPPSHATLNHLCLNETGNEVLGAAVTQRYRRKFMTTIYYKSID